MIEFVFIVLLVIIILYCSCLGQDNNQYHRVQYIERPPSETVDDSAHRSSWSWYRPYQNEPHRAQQGSWPRHRPYQNQSHQIHHRSRNLVDRGFIQHLVNTFKGQCVQGYQFAVLVLSPERYITRENTGFKSTVPIALTDNTNPTHPPVEALGNYIVARPDGPHHAEGLLMSRFHSVWERRLQNLCLCQSIVLYSWLFPCRYCAQEIVLTLGPYANSHQVIVVYTSVMRDMEQAKVERIIQHLESRGIRVIKMHYNRRLEEL